MKYDNQVILQTERDGLLYQMSERLVRKNQDRSTHYFVDLSSDPPGLERHCGPDQPPIGSRSRVYIVGHGTIECLRVAGLTGQQMANKIAPLLPSGAARISLVACFSTMWSRAMEDSHGERVRHNFAQQFHWWLGTADGHRTSVVRTEVSAHGALVMVGADGRKQTGFYNNQNVPEYQAKVRENKLIYRWLEDGRQAVGFDPNYPTPMDIDMPMDID